MKASELRIGNFVSYHNRHERVIAIPQIADENELRLLVGDEHSSTSDSVSKFNPIPLTKEWKRRFDISIFEFRKCAGGFTFFIRIGDMELQSFVVNKIEYVHELQNWHSVIFGTELATK